MPYTLWHVGQSTKTSRTRQAFVFDGWSHEPLVLNRDASVAPRRDTPETADQRLPPVPRA